MKITDLLELQTYTDWALRFIGDMNTDVLPDSPAKSAPVFTNLTTEIDSKNEKGVLLQCSAKGNPEPNISWFFNGNSLRTDSSSNSLPLAEKWTLDFKKLNDCQRMNGNYTCFVCNGLGCILHSFNVSGAFQTGEKTDANMAYNLPVIFAILLISAIIILALIWKLKNGNEKEKHEVHKNETAVITHWTKNIRVEKSSRGSNGQIEMPVIEIGEEKLCQVQTNTTNLEMRIEYKLPEDSNWEIPRRTLSLDRLLGEGEFGKVMKADCVGILGPGLKSVVAVKMLKDDHTDRELMALVSEMEIMKKIGKHKNIINLLGCCTKNGPLYVIVEYAANGCLKDFLRALRPIHSNNLPKHTYENDAFTPDHENLTFKDLVSFSYQIAKGMEYLSSKKCIHRDLAARNVLVSDDLVMKIADFGLAKSIHYKNYYTRKSKGKLPVRWMAPEALCRERYTSKSDVWSFGVLVWEIMTLGRTPYPTIRGEHMYQHISAGHRLKKPPSCSDEIYAQILKCWSFIPEERPSFTKLVEDFDNILTTLVSKNYIRMDE